MGQPQAWARAHGPLLQLMDGWCTPTLVLGYATLLHSWAYHAQHRQQVPICKHGELALVNGSWAVLALWDGWIRRESMVA